MPYPHAPLLEDSARSHLLDHPSALLDYYNERDNHYANSATQSLYARPLFNTDDRLSVHGGSAVSQRASRSRSLSSIDTPAHEHAPSAAHQAQRLPTLESLTFLSPDFSERFGTAGFYSQLASKHLRNVRESSADGQQRDFAFATTISFDYLCWEVRNEFRDIERTGTTDHGQLGRVRECLVAIKQIYGRAALTDILDLYPGGAGRASMRRVFTPASHTTRDVSEARLQQQSLPSSPARSSSSRTSSPALRDGSGKRSELLRTWNLVKTLVDFGVDVAGSVTLIPYFIFVGAWNLMRDTGAYVGDSRLWKLLRRLWKRFRAAGFPFVLLAWMKGLFND